MLFQLTIKFLKKNKINLVIAFIQFLIIFLILQYLSALLLDQYSKRNELSKGVGENTWTIEAAIKNIKDIDGEGHLTWLKTQVDALNQQVSPQHLSYSYIDYNQASNQGYSVLYVEQKLYDRIADQLNSSHKPYMYTNINNENIQNIAVGKNNFKAEQRFLLTDAEVIDSLTNGLSQNYILLPTNQFPYDNISVQINMFIYDLDSQNFDSIQLLNELNSLNPRYEYSISQTIDSSTTLLNYSINDFLSYILISVMALSLIMIGFIGFLLVQFYEEKRNLQLLRIMGASTAHVFILFLTRNILIFLPAFIIATLIGSVSLRTQYGDIWMTMFLLNLLGMVGLIILATLPSFIKTVQLNLIDNH
ncbi:hypothetical protein L2089_13850 [Paenibacillus hunanensis]|uniref:ABC transporter permease n=1 Tax=Paenibacillus hunanensis TaxID=539262 RepID=UPI0020271869|nr:FtsX-like permease family protein [Paenibacillus hunanensis]MCL9661780.1 hypothetical protein [Paenibacillus hunanensis]